MTPFDERRGAQRPKDQRARAHLFVTQAMRWAPSRGRILFVVGEAAGDNRGQAMKTLTSVGVFASPKRKRKTKDWFERAKLVVAAARDRAVERAQQRAGAFNAASSYRVAEAPLG
jgi:hypothetical protein